MQMEEEESESGGVHPAHSASSHAKHKRPPPPAALRPLPSHFEELLQAFVAVDAGVTFLLKRDIQPSVKVVLAIATGVYAQSRPGRTVSVGTLRQLLAACPSAFLVRQVPRAVPSSLASCVSVWGSPSVHRSQVRVGAGGGAADELAFIELLVQPAGGGAGRVAARRAAFEASLHARVLAAHTVFLAGRPREGGADPARVGEVGEEEEGEGAAQPAKRRRGKGKAKAREGASSGASGDASAVPVCVWDASTATAWHPAFDCAGVPHVELAPLPGLTGAESFQAVAGEAGGGGERGGPAHSPPAQGEGGGASAVAAFFNLQNRTSGIGVCVGGAAGSSVDSTGPAAPPVACTVATLPDYLRALPQYVDQIAHVRVFPGRRAAYAALPPGVSLPVPVRAALAARGITELFTHQAKAIGAALSGRHVILSTPTSSGKSVCFHAPVFTALLRAPTIAVALYIFPTKALAQDQLRGLAEFIQGSGSPHLIEAVRPAVLDGDTPFAERDAIRAGASIILTNPDLMHATLLPQHSQWARVLAGLRYVVLDEAHVYRGVFGTHVALVMRRLLRLCALYGSTPQFVLASATIANPRDLFRALVPRVDETQPAVEVVAVASSRGSSGSARREAEDNVTLVDSTDDGSAVGTRTLLVWQPPILQRFEVKEKEDTGSGSTDDDARAGGSSGSGSGGGAKARAKDSGDPRAVAAHVELQAPAHAVDVAVISALTGQRPAEMPVIVAAYAAMHGADAHPPTPGDVKGSDATGCALVQPPAWFQDLMANDLLSEGRKQALVRYMSGRGQAVLPNASVDKDYRGRAVASRTSEPAVRMPSNYRRNAAATPFGMEQHTGEALQGSGGAPAAPPPVPGWVQRWRQRMVRTQEGQQGDPEAAHRRSPIVEAAVLISALVTGGLRTIVFVRVRKVAELLLQYVHERLAALDNEWVAQQGRALSSEGSAISAPTVRPLSLIGKVKSYRAGYLKSHRRAIEGELFSGSLLAVVATNALELGVDIGSLDAVVMLGYPGSASSLWQQAGRAGRGGKDSVSILVAYDSPVDQLLVREPDVLLARRAEAVNIDVANPNILRMHALCAAAEAPLCPWDIRLFGTALGPVVARLRDEGALLQDDAYDDEAGQAGVGLQLYRGRRAEQARAPVSTPSAQPPSPPSPPSSSFGAARMDARHANGWTWVQDTSAHDVDAQLAVMEAEEAVRYGAGVDVRGAAELCLVASGLADATPGTAFGPTSTRTQAPVGTLHAWRAASWTGRPASKVTLRSIEDSVYQVVEQGTGRVVDTVEESRAYWEVHEGATYMNQGVTYRVVRMDTAAKISYVRVTNEQYYTSLQDHQDVNVVSRSATSLDGRTHFGRVQVVIEAWGYRKVWKRTGQVFEFAELALPPISYDTFALWSDIPLAVKVAMDKAGLDYLGGAHAAGHAVLAVLPLFVLSDRTDVGTECPAPMQRRARPLRFVVYDAVPGGVGIAAAAFTVAAQVYTAALRTLETCACVDGCPSCCHDMACKEFNYVIDKRAAVVVLRAALGLDIGIPAG